ncbi:MAG: endonuclease/exonuclease/phosphatase family protein, partial [Saccharospirillaceae bacterium]|nr:endonuclease/exonuclease/phosphatase family protein [Saccharospirillaceae bacterium]
MAQPVHSMHPNTWNLGVVLPPIADAHIKLAFVIIVSVLVKKVLIKATIDIELQNDGHATWTEKKDICSITFGKPSSKISRILFNLLLWISIINLILVIIVNPSLLNPGPTKLSVYYQNVQGLIPFSHLHEDHPNLDHTKILELNSYISQHKPDIVVLNETWLKKTINDNEIIQCHNYKIFRTDRSTVTHPPDPTNISRCKRNGGGVMIAVRSDIDGVSKKLKLNDGTEMSAMELTLANKSKLIFCTCYRVGTLGLNNHRIISENLRSLSLRNKKNTRMFVIGDFNLSTIQWPIDDNPPITNL